MVEMAAREVDLLLYAVADHDHLFDVEGLLVEPDVEYVLVTARRDFEGFVPQERKEQRTLLRGEFELEGAFAVGRRAERGAFQDNADAGHGFARLFVGDRAGDRARLGMCDRCRKEQADKADCPGES